jgi:hypothetical protein
MRIEYLTSDEVNQTLARRLAKKCKAKFVAWPLLGPPPNGRVDGEWKPMTSC